MKKIVSLLILVACFFSVGFVNNQKCSAASVSWLLASTGHDEYNKGHYEDAIRLLNEALPGLNDASSKPQRQKALCWLGDTYAVGYNNYEKAIEYYNQAISIDVRNKYTPVMYSDRGTSNLRLGNYEKAIYDFYKAYFYVTGHEKDYSVNEKNQLLALYDKNYEIAVLAIEDARGVKLDLADINNIVAEVQKSYPPELR